MLNADVHDKMQQYSVDNAIMQVWFFGILEIPYPLAICALNDSIMDHEYGPLQNINLIRPFLRKLS